MRTLAESGVPSDGRLSNRISLDVHADTDIETHIHTLREIDIYTGTQTYRSLSHDSQAPFNPILISKLLAQHCRIDDLLFDILSSVLCSHKPQVTI